MLAFGPPANRRARQEWWRRQIQRQSDGNLSVAEFCRRLGVSSVTFYAWNRRFRETPQASRLVAKMSTPKPSTANGAATSAFVPVSVLNTGATGQLEIELANACVVRLAGTVDPALLRVAIRTAGRLGDRRQGGD